MDKKEYIERGALIDILDAKSEMAMGTPKAVFASVAKMVELLPAADVEEVRHGEWIFRGRGEDYCCEYECSLCGKVTECFYEAGEPYCHCGAKMDATDNNVGDK